MSFAQGFAIPAGLGASRHDPQPLTEEEESEAGGGEMVQVVEYDDGNDSEASSDSMASCPVRGPSRYKKTFKETTLGVFKVHNCIDGMNHADFVRRIGELRTIGVRHEVDDDSLYLHVICNQYAAACKLENGKQWEDWVEMRAHYNDGTLPRYKPPVAITFGHKKSKTWHFESVEPPAEAYTMRNFLDSHGLGSHHQLHQRMEAAAVLSLRNRGLPEPPVHPRHDALGFVVHAFDAGDAIGFEALMPAVMKEQLRDDMNRLFMEDASRRSSAARTVPVARSQSAPRPGGAPQRVRYSPTDEDLERDMDQDEKVTWNGNVLSKINVQDIIENSPHQSKILSGLNRAITVEEAVSQIAMKCGAAYIRKPTVYKPQPEMNEEKRRVYTRAMLPSMFACAVDVLDVHVYRFEK
jgi:hypothetical protein